ncbi:hypothetical protein HDU76_009077, partial [Blyttiomyces sp. JEL0837]
HRDAFVKWASGKDSHNNTLPSGYNGIVAGGNFQLVSVAQKIQAQPTKKILQGGYTDAKFTPSAQLALAFGTIDQYIGDFVAALKASGKWDTSIIVISAKHGQAPVDQTLLVKIDEAVVVAATGYTADDITYTSDDSFLVWAHNQTQAADICKNLIANKKTINADDPDAKILCGQALIDFVGADPKTDSKVPDVIVLPNEGTMYSTSAKKDMEHGGGSEGDMHVGLFVAGGAISRAKVVEDAVATKQIAPTLLRALGINPLELQGVCEEGTKELPGIFYDIPAISTTSLYTVPTPTATSTTTKSTSSTSSTTSTPVSSTTTGATTSTVKLTTTTNQGSVSTYSATAPTTTTSSSVKSTSTNNQGSTTTSCDSTTTTSVKSTSTTTSCDSTTTSSVKSTTTTNQVSTTPYSPTPSSSTTSCDSTTTSSVKSTTTTNQVSTAPYSPTPSSATTSCDSTTTSVVKSTTTTNQVSTAPYSPTPSSSTTSCTTSSVKSTTTTNQVSSTPSVVYVPTVPGYSSSSTSAKVSTTPVVYSPVATTSPASTNKTNNILYNAGEHVQASVAGVAFVAAVVALML